MSTLPFATMASIRAALADLPAPDAPSLKAARARNARLTKPPHALGRLEDLAIWYASWRGTDRPAIKAPQIVIFAGNHGVAARGVSAFPPAVTAQMVANFQAGGAAVNQLAQAAGARFDVVPLDLDRPTSDITEAPAMTEDAFCAAMSAGWRAVDPGADLFVAGEMGIGNTTAAAAMAASLYGGAAADWTGRGTGLDDARLAVKSTVVGQALARHAAVTGRGLETLRCLGGREIAAMAGAILRARQLSIPVILDGFICCAAAAALDVERPGALDHAVAGHMSAEAGHGRLLQAMGKPPLLHLDMRLGEGSGAALAIGILRGAVACLSGMATFDEAGVSDT
ncbi:nicotinate-nucleotide--dimethylbenzimidazole phosphoribosyltransferase [Meridianimarinicoccus sp. RP-17]|uniref:nicotinate-nucleotide--dimethylbenzimidazole phosphoribosyltransferase n=1 Tax=Meridianimarinicoccus zhengii TaxID=2056810 RepID=UPI000DACB287|nr:nicotinate-nucleotide--dimethylbenzimidazole phosphoribosyltransferase [Phycocomes zhengii]